MRRLCSLGFYALVAGACQASSGGAGSASTAGTAADTWACEASGIPESSGPDGTGGASDVTDGNETAGTGPGPANVGDPILLFSDLTFAPSSGWSAQDPNLGAVVTLWGHNFGTERGGSFVSVNGTDLLAAESYVDAWGKTANPVPFLESITFQLDERIDDGTGELLVTVGSAVSNPIPFRVGPGSIYFVDINAGAGGSGSLDNPWQDPAAYIDVMAPGDVAYFRAGVYNEIYNGGKSNIWVRDSEPSGTAQRPIAFVGYPGEWPLFDSSTNGSTTSFNRSVVFDADYLTISKVATTAFGSGIELGDYGRAVGNDIVGCLEFLSGTGIITSSGDGGRILGNTTHGARTGNRFDHAIYLSGCSPVAGSEIGFNFSYDNEFDRGPHYVVNHQEQRCEAGEYLKSHSIHHNLIDCTGSPSRAVGVYDQSWDEGERVEPEPTYVYNNITKACGQGGFSVMSHSNGHAVFHSNTFVDSVGPGFSETGGNVLSTQVVNNVFVQAMSETPYITGDPSWVDNNLYFGAGSYAGPDTHAVQGDPGITMETLGAPYVLAADSPVVDQGVGADEIATDDFNATPRPQGAAHDIGAVERMAE